MRTITKILVFVTALTAVVAASAAPVNAAAVRVAASPICPGSDSAHVRFHAPVYRTESYYSEIIKWAEYPECVTTYCASPSWPTVRVYFWGGGPTGWIHGSYLSDPAPRICG